MKKIIFALTTSLILTQPVLAHETPSMAKQVEVEVEKQVDSETGLVTTIETRKETWIDPATGKTMTKVIKRKMNTRENEESIALNDSQMTKDIKNSSTHRAIKKTVKVEKRGNETHTLIEVENLQENHKVIIHHVRIFDPVTSLWSEQQKQIETFMKNGKQVKKTTKIEQMNGQVNQSIDIIVED